MTSLNNKYDNLVSKLILMAYVASVMLFSYSEGKTYITKLVAVFVILAFLYHFLVKNNKLLVTREWGFLCGWLLIAVLSMFIAVDSAVSYNRIVTLLQVLPISYILFCLLIWLRTTNPIWFASIIVLIVISIITLRNPAEYSDFGRLRGTFNNSNLFGLGLLVSISALIYYFLTIKNKLIRLSLLPLILFLFYMVTESGSRKALVVVLLIVGLFAYSLFKAQLKTSVVSAMLILVVGVTTVIGGAVYITQSKHYERIERILDAIEANDASKAGGSETGRLMLYEKGLEIAVQNPAFGIGLDNFRLISTDALGGSIGTYSHSNLIELLVGTGVVGFLLYYSIYISILIRLYKIRKRKLSSDDEIFLIFISSLFVSYFIYDFAMVSYYEKVSWLFLTVIMAGTYILESKVPENKIITESKKDLKLTNKRFLHIKSVKPDGK